MIVVACGEYKKLTYFNNLGLALLLSHVWYNNNNVNINIGFHRSERFLSTM